MEIRNKRTVYLVQLAILSAILFIMGFTPLGSIPVGPGIVATIAQVPVVIGACIMGKKAGAFLGGVFGFVSFLYFVTVGAGSVSAFMFNPFAAFKTGDSIGFKILFAFSALIICFLPRIMIGLVSGLVFDALKKKCEPAAYILSGIAGALTNTVLVLGLTALIFGNLNGHMLGVKPGAVFAMVTAAISINAVMEILVTPVLSYAISKPVNKFINHR